MVAILEDATGSIQTDSTTSADGDDDEDAPLDSRSSLNFAVTDGETVCITRFRSGNEDPPSLYYAQGGHYDVVPSHGTPTAEDTEEKEELTRSTSGIASDGTLDTVLVASEPLDFCNKWKLIPAQTLMTISIQGAEVGTIGQARFSPFLRCLSLLSALSSLSSAMCGLVQVTVLGTLHLRITLWY